MHHKCFAFSVHTVVVVRRKPSFAVLQFSMSTVTTNFIRSIASICHLLCVKLTSTEYDLCFLLTCVNTKTAQATVSVSFVCLEDGGANVRESL